MEAAPLDQLHLLVHILRRKVENLEPKTTEVHLEEVLEEVHNRQRPMNLF